MDIGYEFWPSKMYGWYQYSRMIQYCREIYEKSAAFVNSGT